MEYKLILKELEENYGWTDTKEFTEMQKELVMDVAKIVSSQIEPKVIKKNAEVGKVYCGNCYECLKDKREGNGLPTIVTRMILCPTCGNKRCPKATDHNLDCTNSNESGQPGSRY